MTYCDDTVFCIETETINQMESTSVLRHQNSGLSSFSIVVMDAMGKLPIGLFQGNLNWIGQYDQCYQMKVNETDVFIPDPVNREFDGSYFDVKMSLPKSLNIPAPVSNSYSGTYY